jgi:hypothetical protein
MFVIKSKEAPGLTNNYVLEWKDSAGGAVGLVVISRVINRTIKARRLLGNLAVVSIYIFPIFEFTQYLTPHT